MDYDIFSPYICFIAVGSSILTSSGAVRTIFPYFLCNAIIVECISPFREWYIIHIRDHLAQNGPGTLRSGSKNRACTKKAMTPKANINGMGFDSAFSRSSSFGGWLHESICEIDGDGYDESTGMRNDRITAVHFKILNFLSLAFSFPAVPRKVPTPHR